MCHRQPRKSMLSARVAVGVAAMSDCPVHTTPHALYLCLRSNGTLWHYTSKERGVTKWVSIVQNSSAPIADLEALNGNPRYVPDPLMARGDEMMPLAPVVVFHNSMVLGPLPRRKSDMTSIKVLTTE